MTEINQPNNLVATANRFQSPNFNTRKPPTGKPTHIVVHITGTDQFTSVKNEFMAKNSVSSHYLIDKAGELFQFVPDNQRAWHAGIDSATRALYRTGKPNWQKYLKYFNWYKSYPKDSVYLDVDLKSVRHPSEAAYVARPDGSSWSHYDYFNIRWADMDVPVNFSVDPDPNNYSIGIETLGTGSVKKDSKVYTEEMYKKLIILIKDLSGKYDIPVEKERVIGHEDVNPITRFGWDPASGFDWERIWASR